MFDLASSTPPDACVRVFFPLLEEGNGSRDCAAEMLWARPAADFYEIHTVPFHAPGVHKGDLVAAVVAEDDTLEFVKVVEASGHETVVAAVLAPAILDLARGAAGALGCTLECADDRDLIAIDVPPEADAEALVAWLDRAEAAKELAWWVNSCEEESGPGPGDVVPMSSRVPTCACCGVPLIGEGTHDDDLVLLEVGRRPTPFFRIPFGEEPGAGATRSGCPSCQARPGELHAVDCQRERCPHCRLCLSTCPCTILGWGRQLEEDG